MANAQQTAPEPGAESRNVYNRVPRSEIRARLIADGTITPRAGGFDPSAEPDTGARPVLRLDAAARRAAEHAIASFQGIGLHRAFPVPRGAA